MRARRFGDADDLSRGRQRSRVAGNTDAEGFGDGVASASVATRAPRAKSSSSRALRDLRRVRPGRHEPRQPLGRQRRRGRGDHEVAEAAALERLHLGEHDDVLEHRLHRRDLAAGERQPRAVGDVHEQHAVGRQEAGRLREELDGGEVRRRLRARVDVRHDEVGGADEPRG